MTIGEKIKLYRDTHGESQRQFAIKAGVSNTTIASVEKGINPNTGKAFAPDTETIGKIAHAMGISVNDLLADVDDFIINIAERIPVRSFPPEAEPLLDAWTDGLNREGQKRLMEYVELLLGNPKYTK